MARPALLTAILLAVLAQPVLLAGCGEDDAAAPSVDESPLPAEPGEPTDSPEPVEPPPDEPIAPARPVGPTLAPGDAEELAHLAAETWALGMGGVLESAPSCSPGAADLAYCEATVVFEDNPGNVQTCALPLAVVATRGRTGPYEHPASPYGGGGIEQEDFELPSGGLGTYEVGDSSECEQAQYESGF
jgi:hypothetical protein